MITLAPTTGHLLMSWLWLLTWDGKLLIVLACTVSQQLFHACPLIRFPPFRCLSLLPLSSFKPKNVTTNCRLFNLTRKFLGGRALNPAPKSCSSAIQLLVQKAVTVNWPNVADKDWTLPGKRDGQTGEDRVTYLPIAPDSPLSPTPDSDAGANVDEAGKKDPCATVVYSEETPGMCDPKLPVPKFTISTLEEDPAEQDLVGTVHWSFCVPDLVMDYEPEQRTSRAGVTRLIVVDFTAQAQVEVTRFNWLELETDTYHRREVLSTDLKSLMESLVKSNWSPFSNEASCEIFWALASHPDVPKIGPIARVMDSWDMGNVEYLMGEDSPIPVTASSKYCQRVLLVVCPYKAPVEPKSGKILKPKDAAAVAWLKQAVAQDTSLTSTIELIKSTKKGQPVQELVRWMTAIAKILSDYGRVPHRVADEFGRASGQKISKVHIGHLLSRDPNWIGEAEKVNQQRVRLVKAFDNLPKGAPRTTARLALRDYLGSDQIAGMESFGRKLTSLETEHLEVPEIAPTASSDEGL
ncbi:hypothetical protein GGX14DRAFT_399141 [Mycena pura]|uniref:Uncharacterized protein n=1 Tax=Mycena pura TaxID=153505 RepID=A0AAD6Y8T9_9AGAR|nr:hypothetical protein GGX14DRAFT_399141 [Mycena pura]